METMREVASSSYHGGLNVHRLRDHEKEIVPDEAGRASDRSLNRMKITGMKGAKAVR